jgi:hypothetical protein
MARFSFVSVGFLALPVFWAVLQGIEMNWYFSSAGTNV